MTPRSTTSFSRLCLPLRCLQQFIREIGLVLRQLSDCLAHHAELGGDLRSPLFAFHDTRRIRRVSEEDLAKSVFSPPVLLARIIICWPLLVPVVRSCVSAPEQDKAHDEERRDRDTDADEGKRRQGEHRSGATESDCSRPFNPLPLHSGNFGQRTRVDADFSLVPLQEGRQPATFSSPRARTPQSSARHHGEAGRRRKG